jgi:hypothetical protein
MKQFVGRHRHLCLTAAACLFGVAGWLTPGPAGLVALPVVLTVPGYLALGPVAGRVRAWLAVPVSLAMIVVLSLLSWVVLGAYRTGVVAGLLAVGALVLAWRLDRTAAPLPRVDTRVVAGGLAVTVVAATAFALSTAGTVIPDEPYLQVRLAGGVTRLGGTPGHRTIGVDIVNHTAAQSTVVVRARWAGWDSEPATRVVPANGSITSAIRLPAELPCRGTIEVTVTPGAGTAARKLTRQVGPDDC